jgi:beta-glucosidase
MGDLKKYIEAGEVDIKDIDRMCISIIKTLAQMGYLDGPIKDTKYLENFDQHEQVALSTAREGIVLLRNNNLLPIAEGSDKNILITGMYVTENIYGGGSGEVAGYNIVTIIDALKKVYPNITYKAKASKTEMEKADIVMVSVGTFDYEGCDRHFALTPEQEALVQEASSVNENTLVIVNSGSAIRMNDWSNVNAIVYNWYPGQIGNVALAEILSGKINPSGKLPMTIEKEFKDSPAYGYIPEGTEFMCDAEGYLDVSIQEPELNRWVFDTDIRDAPNKLYDVNYAEGVLVGYRWFDTKNIEPLFPFGFGLSYTTFEVTNAQLSSTEITSDKTLKVSVTITNTGKTAGATVAQLYVGEKNPSVVRPIKELKGFKKVNLEPGESKTIAMYLEKDAFAFWSEESKKWEVNTGTFNIFIGQSSKDINETLSIEIK